MLEESNAIASQLEDWSKNLEAFLDEIRQHTIQVMLPFIVVVAILLGIAVPTINVGEHMTSRIVVPLWLLGFAVIVWVLRKFSYTAAAWILFMGSLFVTLQVIQWKEMLPAIHLFAVQVALITGLISRKAGGIIAALFTLGLWFTPQEFLPISAFERNVCVIEIWGVYAMISIVLSPLVTATAWAWSGYQQSLVLLQQVRDYQEQYQVTVADLSKVNAQLTRLHQHAQQLRLVAEEERRIKEQFVANISHELRTPLNMIIGFSEMILKAPENYSWDFPPKLLADLDVIQRNSQHLSELVDDVLDLSQIEAGRMALTREYVNLGEIIQAAVVAVRYLYESKNLSLDVNIPANLPQVFCDRTRIREVVLNLLSNAGRFTETGGVRIQAWHEGMEIVVSVQDTGAGISKDDQMRLFQPFHQVDSSLRRHFGGTGLGLSLSKSFVELHDGKMWLESEKERGTTVYFRLPIAPTVARAVGVTSKLTPDWEFKQRTRRLQAPLPPVKPKLVVVENGKTLQSLLVRYFDAFEVVGTSDLSQAIHDLHNIPAQALLINARMGEEIDLQAIGTDIPIGIPVVICHLQEPEDAASQMGVEDYLIKPIARERLLEKINRFGAGIRTVLIVDDDPDAQQLFHRMLSSAERKYRVLRAMNGIHALEILQTETVDLVLLDLMMPGLSGYQILALRREDPGLMKIPVILISARDPWEKPIVSQSLTFTMRDGLGTQELLECIEALSMIPSKAKTVNSSEPGPTWSVKPPS